MKAVVINKNGGPEVLEYTEVPKPKIGHGEVLIRVHACALNHLDLWTRQGLRDKANFPYILGSDIAGEVAEIGPGVTRTQVGDKVIIAPGVSDQVCEFCLNGQDNLCPQYKILGHLLPGGYAEYVSVPQVNVYPLPEGLNYVEAAALPLVSMTAWHMLITRAQLKPAETVLVLGAGSGVGSAAIQIAKLAGAQVITTAGNEEKLKKAKELGADFGINHSTQDIAAEVKKITKHSGVDVVFEHIGQATWDKSLASLKPGGRLVTCGATTGPQVQLDLRRLFVHQWSLLGSFMGTKNEFNIILQLVAQKKLHPVIGRTFPLAQAADAHRYMEDREQFGKVVLEI